MFLKAIDSSTILRFKGSARLEALAELCLEAFVVLPAAVKIPYPLAFQLELQAVVNLDSKEFEHEIRVGRNPTHHLSEKFVEGLKDELDEASLGRRVRRLLRELPRLRVEVDVAPQTPGRWKGAFESQSSLLLT